jgi:hypothetical protein
MSAFDISLRQQIARYLSGELTLREFREWFLPAVWKQGEEGQLLSPITRRVELRLAEYMNGHWDEDALKSLFSREAPNTGSLGPIITVPFTGVTPVAGPNTSPMESQVSLA